MTEIWRDIKDYEGLYQVSNFIKVMNVKTGKILKPFKTKTGYLQIDLYKDGVRTKQYLHRLLGMTFPDLVDWTNEAKGKPFEEIEINHKDENPENNSLDNLEWCTGYYNLNYGTHNERMAETKRVNPSNNIPVEQYTLDGQFVKEYISTREAERQTGVLHQNIGGCCTGKHKTAGGYIWKYKDYSLS